MRKMSALHGCQGERGRENYAEDAKLMIESGATRIGASASVKISTAFK
jgi:deoxyribose-phosphate aldolase